MAWKISSTTLLPQGRKSDMIEVKKDSEREVRDEELVDVVCASGCGTLLWREGANHPKRPTFAIYCSQCVPYSWGV